MNTTSVDDVGGMRWYDRVMSLRRMLLWLVLIIVLSIVAWLTGSNSPL